MNEENKPVNIITNPFPNNKDSNTPINIVPNSNSANTNPPVTNKPKKRKMNMCLPLFLLFLILFISLLGSFGGIKTRDWLRSQPWYLCLRDGQCSANNISSTKDIKISVSDKNQSYSSPQDVSNLYEKVSPSVVSVTLTQQSSDSNDPLSAPVDSAQPSAIASGFVVNADKGLIVTNDHVVCSSGTYKVVTKDNKSFNVIEINRDQADDLALIRVDVSKDKLPSQLTFAKDSDQVKPGQYVVAIGNPLGDFPTTITTGVISGLNRSITASGTCNGSTIRKDYDAVFQTDASINPGNSGGPLLNIDGEVIGVNSATSPNASNISFSIPSNRVIRKIQEYINNGKFENPFLGVRYYMITPDDPISQIVPNGAYVRDVVTGSPADQGGIKTGDIITKFGSKDVNFSLQTQISSYNVGDTVDVVVKRRTSNNTYSDVNLKVKLVEQSTTGQ